MKRRALKLIVIFGLCIISSNAKDNSTKEMQDMSDPLAVYTQAGFGITSRGINLKIGQAYDTGNPNTIAMNLLEIKGMLGDSLGWEDDGIVSNSIDSFRYRNFSVDITNGRGSQLDIIYNLHNETGNISYSFLQALPKFGNLNLYPLAGLGVAFANNALQDDGTTDSGYSIPGVLGVVGVYAKYAITDKLWVNYNPLWSVGIAGSDLFMDYGFEGDSSVLAHEFALAYQINSRMNIKYFANWTENVDFQDGDHRIEFNYQF